jgi:predicted GIY-YIG superfamily endonuclease
MMFPAAHRNSFFYVYILQSEIDPSRFYTGFTRNLETRLKDHNTGKDPHTAKFRPWKVKTTIAFSDRQKALDFERYLKSPSGRAFARKRL